MFFSALAHRLKSMLRACTQRKVVHVLKKICFRPNLFNVFMKNFKMGVLAPKTTTSLLEKSIHRIVFLLLGGLILIGANSALVAQTTLCVGNTSQLTYSGSGGSWVTGNSAVATVSSGGLVTATGAGSTTVNYQTSSSTNTSLYWNFDNSPSVSGSICTYNATTTSNSGLLSGVYTSSGSSSTAGLTPWSTWGNCVKQINFGPQYSYIQFVTTAASTNLSSMQFQVWHNHNSGQAGTSAYDVRLQISTLSGGTWSAWSDVGSSFSWSPSAGGNPGPNSTHNISLTGNSVPAGTHRIRWFKASGTSSTNGDGYIMNTVTFNCQAVTASVLNTNTINVNALPAQPSTISSPATICPNSAGTYSVTNVAGVTYTWTYSGTGTITGSGNSISLNASTGGTLTVVPSNSCGSGTSRTFAISFNALNSGAHDATPQSLCSGGDPANITFTTPSSGGTLPYTYQWQLNNAAISGGTTNAYNPPVLSAGNYSYNCIITDACGNTAATAPKVITVNAAATAPTSITGNSTICPGASVTLTAVGGVGSAYQWGTGNTPGSNTIAGQTGATLTVSPTATTTYWVRRTQVTPCTGTATGGTTFTVSISSIPTATASASSTTVCPGVNTTLNVTANQVIAAQDFDNVNTLGYSLSSGIIGTGTVGSSGMPINATHGINNSNAYNSSNATRTMTFDNVTNLTSFTNKKVEFRLAALSVTSGNGQDAADNVRCSISIDGGATYSEEIQVNGNDQNTWSYTSGTGVAEVTYDGNNSVFNVTPSVGGVSTTEGYSTVRINLPDALSQVRVKIRMDNNSANEIWAIDDIRITGTPTSFSWAITAAPSTILATTASSTQSPTTNTTYVVTVTNGVGCTATSQVAVTVTSPTLATSPNSGNVIWRGATSTDWNTASNWYNFDGTAYTVASAVPTNAIDVIIPANQTCVLAQPSVLSTTTNEAKNVLIETGATLTLAGGTLSVAGDWTNNGTFTGSTGTVSFNGTGTATLGGTSSTTFANLSMDKSGSVSLSTPVTVNGSLALNDGIIDLGANNLTLGSASVSGGSATSYVKTASTGTMSRIGGATATTFPVGNSAYNPAVLTNNGTSDVFSVRVIDNVTSNGTGVGTTSTLATVKRTWMISEATTGGSNASVRLYWNGTGEEINGFASASAFVAHYSIAGSMWENMGGGAGAGYVQSTDAITSFSPFTISSTNLFAPLPVELLSFDAQCADQDIIVRWTTASEHNTLNFIVQRSEEGTMWNDVQTVEAAGNSNTVLNYAIQDMGAARGTKYYRLVQTDQDGVQKIYGPILTNCGSDATSFLTFPNPSTDEFNILFGTEDIHGDVVMTVSDATGKVVRNVALFIEKGTTSMMVPSLDLSTGVYQIQLNGENFQSAIIKHSIR